MCLTKAFNIISFLFRSRYWKEAGVRLLAGVEPDFKNTGEVCHSALSGATRELCPLPQAQLIVFETCAPFLAEQATRGGEGASVGGPDASQACG